MRTILTSALALALWVNVAHAEVGVSHFAVDSYDEIDCRNAVAEFRGVRHPVFAVLLRFFENRNRGECLETLLRMCARRPHGCTVIVHAHFSREYPQTTKIIPAVERALRGFYRRYRRLLRHVEVIRSCSLEDKLSTRDWRLCRDAINRIAPGAIVRVPVQQDERGIDSRGAAYIELHGVQPHFRSSRPRIVNLDGVSVRTNARDCYLPSIDVRATRDWIRRHHGAVYRLLWFRRRQVGCGGFQPVGERDPFVGGNDSRVANQLMLENQDERQTIERAP